jgi:hypothetical protein
LPADKAGRISLYRWRTMEITRDDGSGGLRA